MNVEKYKAVGSVDIIHHNKREFEYSEEYMLDPKHSFIDYELTKNNYHIGPDTEKRLNELKKNNKVRNSTTVLMFDWVVQKPIKCDMEDTLFFAELTEFFKDRYGADNFIGADVHTDEPFGRIHEHIMFAPIKDGQFNCKAIINKNDLQTIHDDINEHFKQLGYNVDFHADDYEERKARNEKAKLSRKKYIDNKYKTVEQLRAESALDYENKINEYQNEFKQKELKLENDKKQYDDYLKKEQQRIDDKLESLGLSDYLHIENNQR